MHAVLGPDAEEFLTYLTVERGRSKNSLIAYRHDLAGYEEFLRGRGVGVDAVQPRVIEDYLGFLAASGLSASSRARALVAIRGLHRFCLDERAFTADPTAEVEGPRVPGGIPKALSEVEVESLLEASDSAGATGLRDRAILEVLYGSGLRISELAGLSFGDVDVDGGLLRVMGKGSKERIVPLGRFAVSALGRWCSPLGRAHFVPARYATRDDADAIFLSTRGRRMSRQAIWVVVNRCAMRAGLSDRVTPHVLRHSFATHLLDHGADIRVVQELLGHASITTTQIYTKVSAEHLRRAYLAAHPRASATRRSRTDHPVSTGPLDGRATTE